jgi:hypothetical protein
MVKINKFASFFSEKMRKIGISSNEKSILHNSALLYFVLFISLANILYYAVEGRYFFIMVFLFIGYLTHFFSKNMIVIMCISVAFTHILSSGLSNNAYGRENMDVHETMTGSMTVSELKDALSKNTASDTDTKTVSKPESTPSPTDSNENTIKITDEDIKEMKEMMEKINVTPSPTPKKDKDGDLDMDIDSRSIDEINAQTRELIKTQKQLLQNMNTLSPLLSQAESFLGNFNH